MHSPKPCLLALVLLFGRAASAQDAAVLVTLAPPTFPEIARAAHITGDLELTVKVNKDGTVFSAIVDTGPALTVLRDATLASVKQSRFECHGCGDEPATIRVEYSYSLDDSERCEANSANTVATEVSSPYPRISHSGNHVTIVGLPVIACDPRTETTKVRSIKCLYLWACSSK
jgi:hypothetical protein